MAETPATKRRKSDRENRFAWKDPDWEPPESFADCVTKWLEASDGTAPTPDTAMAFNFHSRDAENFVPSVHITMETFQKSLTLARTRGIGIRTNPGLALTLLNNLTPVLFHLPIRYLAKHVESEVAALIGLSAFIYVNGYVPWNKTGGGKVAKWVPYMRTSGNMSNRTSDHEEPPEVTLYSLRQDHPFFRGGPNIPDVVTPEKAFDVACEVVVPALMVLYSRLHNEAPLKGIFRTKSNQSYEVRMTKICKRVWKKTCYSDNGKRFWSSVQGKTSLGGLINNRVCEAWIPLHGKGYPHNKQDLEGGDYKEELKVLEEGDKAKKTPSPNKKKGGGASGATTRSATAEAAADDDDGQSGGNRKIHLLTDQAYQFLLPNHKPNILYHYTPVKGITGKEFFRLLDQPKLVDHISKFRDDPTQTEAMVLPPIIDDDGTYLNMNLWFGRNGKTKEDVDARQMLGNVSSFPSQPFPHRRHNDYFFDFEEHFEDLKKGNSPSQSARAYSTLPDNTGNFPGSESLGNKRVGRAKLDGYVDADFLRTHASKFEDMDVYPPSTAAEQQPERTGASRRASQGAASSGEKRESEEPHQPNYEDDDF